MSSLEFDLDIEVQKIFRKLDMIDKRFEQVAREAMESGQKMDKSFKKAQQSSGGLVNKLSGLVKGLREISSNMTGIGTLGLAAGIGAAANKIYQMADETIKYRQQVQQLTGESGKTLADLTASIEASSKTFNKGFSEMSVANHNFAESMNISEQAASELIDKGFLAGADASDEFLDKLKEYGPQFKAAGLSAEQSIALMTQEVKSGIYSDKGVDTIKEGTIRLREMTNTTRDAIDGIGISSKQLETDLKSGTITYYEAIQKVSRKLGELPPQSAQVGTAIADIFGGAGEDAGLEYIKLLGDIKTSMDDMVKGAGETAIAMNEMLEANKRWSKSWSDMLGEQNNTISAARVLLTNFAADSLTKIANVDLVFKRASKFADDDMRRVYDAMMNLSGKKYRKFQEIVQKENELTLEQTILRRAAMIAELKETGQSQTEAEKLWDEYYKRRDKQYQDDREAKRKAEKEGSTNAVDEAKKRSVKVIEDEIKGLQKEQKELAENTKEWDEYQKKIDVLNKERAGIKGKDNSTEAGYYDKLKKKIKAANDAILNGTKEQLPELQKKLEALKEEEAAWLAIIKASRGEQGTETVKSKATPVIGDSLSKEVKGALKPMKTLTAEEEKQLRVEAKKLDILHNQKEIYESMADGLNDSSEILGALSYAIGEVDGELGQALGKVADIAMNASNLFSNLGIGGDPIGAITSGIGALGNIIGVISSLSDADKANNLEAINQLYDIQNRNIEKQIDLLRELEGQERSKEEEKITKQYEEQLRLLNLRASKADVETKLRKKFMGLFPVWTKGYTHEAESVQDLIDILNRADIQDSLAKGDIKIANMDEIQQIIDEYNALLQEMEDFEAQKVLERLGFETSTVADTIFQGVQDGLKLAGNELGDWSENFGELVKKSLSQNILKALNNKWLVEFMEFFNIAMGDDDLSGTELVKLEDLYTDAISKAEEKWNALKPIFEKYGAPFEQEGLTGAISGITEETASLIAGQFTAMRVDLKTMSDLSKNQLEMMDQSLSVLEGIKKNTSHNYRLKAIEENIADTNRILNSKLG